MGKIFFVGGASGSGKSSVIKPLQITLGGNYNIYDFDDIGVPKNADKKWRQESTNAWIAQLLKEEKDSCLLGQIVLGEIVSCPAAKNIEPVNFCLLDVSDIERIRRLKERGTYGADQNMLSWAAWLRMHHQAPSWCQNAIKDDSWNELNFEVWDHRDSWDSKVKILDTTNLPIDMVVNEIKKWILNESNKFCSEIEFLEKELMQSSTRKDIQRLGAILDDDFIEIGASGLVYDRNNILDSLPKESPREYESFGFEQRPIANNAILITYAVKIDNEFSFRSSIWSKRSGVWKILFHQGTKKL